MGLTPQQGCCFIHGSNGSTTRTVFESWIRIDGKLSTCLCLVVGTKSLKTILDVKNANLDPDPAIRILFTSLSRTL